MWLATSLEGFDLGKYDDACADASMDVSRDRIIFRFLTGVYRDWLLGDEDEDDEMAEKMLGPHIQAMSSEVEESNEWYVQQMEAWRHKIRHFTARLRKWKKMHQIRPNWTCGSGSWKMISENLQTTMEMARERSRSTRIASRTWTKRS